MALDRKRRRELGWLTYLLVLAVYFYELTKGTKYFAVRHSAFIHPLILFSAAGGIAQLGMWLQTFVRRRFGLTTLAKGVSIAVTSVLLVILTAQNVPVISKYYVDGLDAQFLPYRSMIEFVADNIKADEAVILQGPIIPWFFLVYAPHLQYVRVDDKNFELRPNQNGFWYFGPHKEFQKPGFTQMRFDIPTRPMGYCRRENEFTTSVAKFSSSAVAFIDDMLLRTVPETELFLQKAIPKARALRDRKQRAAVLSIYSEYLRLNYRRKYRWNAWKLAEESVQADPYNQYNRYHSAHCSILIGNYELAVQRAKESIEMGFYLPPLGVLDDATVKSGQAAMTDEDLLQIIDRVLAVEHRQVRKHEKQIRKLRNRVQRRIDRRLG